MIVADSDGHPYISAHSEQLERLRIAFEHCMDGVQVISLNASGVPLPGQVYLRSTITLPPPAWPDFFVDLVMGCNLVIGQMEQAHDHLTRQREQWLQALFQAQAVAEKLNVHVNTTRYRLRKAEELLGTEQASAQEHIAWGLASSIWMSFHPLE